MAVKKTKSNMAAGILNQLQENLSNEDFVKKAEKVKEKINKNDEKKAKRSFMLSLDVIDKLEDIKYNSRKNGKNMSLSEIVENAIKKYNSEEE